MRILLHNLGAESSRDVEQALAGQGYEIKTCHNLGVDEIIAVAPELLVTEATPSNLSCCGLVSQIKAHPQGRDLKILMIVQGGALERARALDLGANDVISFPFEPMEFVARIRTQFRELEPELELEAKLKEALEREHLAEMAAEALSDGTSGRRRLWMVSLILVLGAAAVAASVAVISNRHGGRDTLLLKAEIARLNSGLLQQQELLRRVDEARDSINANAGTGTGQSLKVQTQEIRKKLAVEGGDINNEALKKELQQTQDRLNRLETETRIAETIVHSYEPSVCLLHVVVQFRDKQSGELIHVASDPSGRPLVDRNGMVTLGTDGNGPVLSLDFFGTGFLVSRNGHILTNHHVAEPWSTEQDLKELVDRGLNQFATYTAYFPGDSQGIPAKLDRVSGNADLATLQLQNPAPPNTAVLEIDDRTEATVAGDPVVLIGYPTGIEGILARAGTETSRKLAENSRDTTQIVSQMAAQQLIRPTVTQGHIGDVLKDKIVYDAATTEGGSGGPLFNRSGKVIGVNFAVLRDFGGSNLAVPVRYADELVK